MTISISKDSFLQNQLKEMVLLTDRYAILNSQTLVSLWSLPFYSNITPSPLIKCILANTVLAKESDEWDIHKE